MDEESYFLFYFSCRAVFAGLILVFHALREAESTLSRYHQHFITSLIKNDSSTGRPLHTEYLGNSLRTQRPRILRYNKIKPIDKPFQLNLLGILAREDLFNLVVDVVPEGFLVMISEAQLVCALFGGQV